MRFVPCQPRLRYERLTNRIKFFWNYSVKYFSRVFRNLFSLPSSIPHPLSTFPPFYFPVNLKYFFIILFITWTRKTKKLKHFFFFSNWKESTTPESFLSILSEVLGNRFGPRNWIICCRWKQTHSINLSTRTQLIFITDRISLFILLFDVTSFIRATDRNPFCFFFGGGKGSFQALPTIVLPSPHLHFHLFFSLFYSDCKSVFKKKKNSILSDKNFCKTQSNKLNENQNYRHFYKKFSSREMFLNFRFVSPRDSTGIAIYLLNFLFFSSRSLHADTPYFWIVQKLSRISKFRTSDRFSKKHNNSLLLQAAGY